MASSVQIKLLRSGNEAILLNVAQGVFDNTVDLDITKEFLSDPRHHLAVAIDNDLVVGMASAVHYLHPDKQPELWINEVGVAPTHQRRGVARELLAALFGVGRKLGCAEAWVLTDRPNTAAMRLYSSVGGKEYKDDLVMFSFHLNPKGD
ncbi:MAG: GNAT family N-acetyltransferase [Tepidisphaeraceae bacterium]|jgi:aminoglycoside 6'-N-acetyltransferase I